jgi:hypothetical protein
MFTAWPDSLPNSLIQHVSKIVEVKMRQGSQLLDAFSLQSELMRFGMEGVAEIQDKKSNRRQTIAAPHHT